MWRDFHYETLETIAAVEMVKVNQVKGKTFNSENWKTGRWTQGPRDEPWRKAKVSTGTAFDCQDECQQLIMHFIVMTGIMEVNQGRFQGF